MLVNSVDLQLILHQIYDYVYTWLLNDMHALYCRLQIDLLGH